MGQMWLNISSKHIQNGEMGSKVRKAKILEPDGA